jgi:hypothetical protein
MKIKLLKWIPAATVLGLVALLAMTAITVRAADKKDAPNPATASSALGTEWNAADWKDPNWEDPNIILTNIAWDGLPLSEVAYFLQHESKGCFDVLFPNDLQYRTRAQATTIDPATGLPIPQPVPTESIDVRSLPMNLRLKNVTLSEVFNAMNLVFETENAPWRWQLVMNGNRPTAVFRILPEHLPNVVEPPLERRIFFVGDLVGDEKSGGMTLDGIATTVLKICKMGLGRIRTDPFLQLHKEAQLLIVWGTPEDIRFVESALEALKQKVALETARKTQPTSSESKAKSEATKTP